MGQQRRLSRHHRRLHRCTEALEPTRVPEALDLMRVTEALDLMRVTEALDLIQDGQRCKLQDVLQGFKVGAPIASPPSARGSSMTT